MSTLPPSLPPRGGNTGGGKSATIARPHATIACQDLLATSDDIGHSGFLRRPNTCKKKGMSFLNTISKTLQLPWLQRYVVLTGGSLYHYDSETSRKPRGCYTLKNYNKVVRAGEITQHTRPWAFKICHDACPDYDKYFAASSERDWNTWQSAIRTQLLLANGLTQGDVPDDIDSEIYSSGELTSRPPSMEDEMESGTDSEDDYDKVDEERVAAGRAMERSAADRPLPATPGGAHFKEIEEIVKRKTSIPSPDRSASHPFLGKMLDKDDDEKTTPKVPPPRNNRQRAPAQLPTQTKPLPQPPSPGLPSPPARTLPATPPSDYKVPPPAQPVMDAEDEDDTPSPQSIRDKLQRLGAQPMMGPGKPLKAAKPSPWKKPEVTKQGSIDTSNRKVPPTPGEVAPRKKAVLPPTMKPKPQPEEENNPYEMVDTASPTSPKPVSSARLSWKDFFWDGHDKDASHQILKNISQDGVFMVRDSEAGHGKTLMCYCEDEGMVKKYKITTTADANYTIKANSEWNFRSMEEMLEHYMHNNLPNRSTQLTVPYNKMMN